MTTYGPTDVLEDTVGDGRTVFVPATDTAVVLNPTAARIWDLMREQVSPEQVAARVADECRVDVEVVRPHVEDTVAELVRQGLLVAVRHE